MAEMKLLYASPIYIGYMSSSVISGGFIRAYTDGTTLRIGLQTKYWSSTTQINRYWDITYDGVTERTSSVTKTNDMETPFVYAEFPYNTSAKTATFQCVNTSGGYYVLTVDGVTTTETSYSITWSGTEYEYDIPVVIESLTGAYVRQENKIRLSVDIPSGCGARILRLIAKYYANASSTIAWTDELAENIAFSEEFSHTPTVKYQNQRPMWYEADIGFYREGVDGEADPDSFFAFTQAKSEVYYAFTLSQIPTPLRITYAAPIAGGRVKISWDNPSVTTSYERLGSELERSTDGGSTWTVIYRDTGTSFFDTVGRDVESVAYRVKNYGKSLVSYAITGPVKSVVQTNLYLGIEGVPVAVGGLYLGVNYVPQAIPPMITVG